MEFTEIIISYYKGSNVFNQIVFINKGTIDFVEPFEFSAHLEYLKLPITTFKEIK